MVNMPWEYLLRPAVAPGWLHDTLTAPPVAPAPSPNGSSAAPGGNQPYVDSVVARRAGHPAHHTAEQGGRYGGRNNQLNVTALTLARMPGVDRCWLREQLLDACRINGELADGGQAKCERTINGAFAKADGDGARPVPQPGNQLQRRVRCAPGVACRRGCRSCADQAGERRLIRRAMSSSGWPSCASTARPGAGSRTRPDRPPSCHRCED